MTTDPLALKGTVWLNEQAERRGKDFPVDLLMAERRTNTVVNGIASSYLLAKQGWERWNIRARSKAEAEETVQKRFERGVLEIRWVEQAVAA